MSVELLEKPLPKPEKDLVGYASARTLEALLETLLALEFLDKGYTRNAAGKLFQAWRALTAALLALHTDKLAAAVKGEEERKWLLEKAVTRVPTTRLKALARLVEEHLRVPYYGPLSDTALSLHDYQYHGPDPDMALSRYRSRSEAAEDIAYLARRIAEIVERHIKPILEERKAWTESHEEALERLRKTLSKIQS